ncbi:sugar kinase [Marinomonas atlantica]|uniref:sugar kinase n=1 Tax=Marinomonas atlantica TaxID=1806668 RepID=UPI00082EC82F|nr:sugar kinase [Marinomonas atlantica]
MKEVLTLGEILVEVMAKNIGQTFTKAGEFLGPFPSGAPAIFINQVAKMGVPATMIGCVGKDDFGKVCLTRLEESGVDCRLIETHEDRPTGTAFVTYHQDGNRDFIFNIQHSAASLCRLNSAAIMALQNCSVFHIMGSSINTPDMIGLVRSAIALVKEGGGLISFDPNVRKELLKDPVVVGFFNEVLSKTDIFMPSGDELLALTNTESVESALKALWVIGVREVVLKKGQQGCDYFDRNNVISKPSFSVKEVDATGAGDTFGGTFVACRVLGYPPERSLQLANAAGALAVSSMGPMEGAAREGELDVFISNWHTQEEVEHA